MLTRLIVVITLPHTQILKHIVYLSINVNCVCVCVCVCVSRSVESDSVISWTVVYQAPLSMEFSSQEYWSRLPFPSPGDLPDPGIEQCIAGRLSTI